MTGHETGRSSGRQGGFTLLEVLVALMLLAIGALGMLSMARLATSHQQQAIFQLRAVAALDDLAGRIRSNPAGIEAYAGPADPGQCASTATAAVRCSPDELAADDLAGWRARHLEALPGASINIDYVAGEDLPGLQVVLSWQSRQLNYRLTRRLVP